MALNINVEHRLVALDDSGITSVAVCLCKRSWVAIGEQRVRDAQYEHALHVFDAGSAMVGSAGRIRELPERDDFPNTLTAPRGRPVGGGMDRDAREAEIKQLKAEGLTAAGIALKAGITVGRVRRILSEISQEK